MVNTGLLTIAVGALGVVLGTLLGPYLNHRLNQKNSREDIVFKKKLEYFEKITESLENNIRLYHSSICKLEESPSNNGTEEIAKKLKAERKRFLIMFSPIYLDSNKLSNEIRCFTDIEKEIFSIFKKLLNREIPKDLSETNLKERFSDLKKTANKILFAIKKEMK